MICKMEFLIIIIGQLSSFGQLNIVPENVCKAEKETCGLQSTDGTIDYGDCCKGFTCVYHGNITGSPGTCMKGIVSYLNT